ncbi:MAG: glycosyltransferase family 2 protein [Gammaproteobacteria bacterium]|nr:glycosyltransferase family 2 protein [Gammaproteobacteria bacterium]
MNETPQVCILILNWNGWQDTLECLESLVHVDYPDYEVLVCDNGSTDESLSQIRSWISEWERDADKKQSGPARIGLIENGHNLGFAGGNNTGLRYVLANEHFEYVWMLNNDTTVDRSALQALVKKSEADKNIGICGSTLLFYDDRTRVQALGGARYNPWLGSVNQVGYGHRYSEAVALIDQSEVPLDYIVGASMLVRTAYLRAVGLMDEKYFLYFEELDWSLRGRKQFRLAYAPESKVYHKYGASIGREDSQDHTRLYRATYYMTRNCLRITVRFFPYAIFSVLGVMTYALLLNIFRRNKTKSSGLWWGMVDIFSLKKPL